MTKLSVNINKVATLRNSRLNGIPDVIQFAKDCEIFGAEGITVHPRPDERHITRKDVYDLRPILKTEFNIEGYPNDEFIGLVLEVCPAQVTLVPDPPDALTSNAGWDVIHNFEFLRVTLETFKAKGIRTSLFMGTDLNQLAAAHRVGADCIELYTEPYALDYIHNPLIAIAPFKVAALYANDLGLKVNAGHDLNLKNLKFLSQELPFLQEVSIGHALISDALYYGIQNTIQMYLNCLKS